ncbi:MAG: phage major tail tube protein [Synergistaceae bacterium]|nr:phage major tail tube protein [Synergistaceae bacterium]
MSNIIPEKSINFSVYLNGEDELGIAEGTIPALEAMTSEVKGAGIAGVVESPVLGHFNSTNFSLTWRTVTNNFMKLFDHVTNDIELFAGLQQYDAGLGVYRVAPLHVYMKAITKTSTPGNLTVGDNMDTQTEFEVLYMKIELDGKERVEMDKINYIYKVDGVDRLSELRVALGKQ